jgi:hypothetical protein
VGIRKGNSLLLQRLANLFALLQERLAAKIAARGEAWRGIISSTINNPSGRSKRVKS